jgi:hypothetical protein
MPPSDSSQRPFHIYGTRLRQTAFGATDFLRGNDRLAALLPTAMRMASLQQDLAAALPAMAAPCGILSFEAGTLVLAVPNAAIATRLKMQLGGLTSRLRQRGWQVEHVRLKVQVVQPPAPQHMARELALPKSAVDAFAELGQALEDTATNAPLKAALARLAARRR